MVVMVACLENCFQARSLVSLSARRPKVALDQWPLAAACMVGWML